MYSRIIIIHLVWFQNVQITKLSIIFIANNSVELLILLKRIRRVYTNITKRCIQGVPPIFDNFIWNISKFRDAFCIYVRASLVKINSANCTCINTPTCVSKCFSPLYERLELRTRILGISRKVRQFSWSFSSNFSAK